jgi:chorismate mutase / prephenate dehydratase
MTAPKPDTSLDIIRREIDAIDDALLDLVIRRFEVKAKVRATKQNDGTIAASPLRPAREAAMLRRLIAQAGGRVAPELLVRLWRVILSASTQSQASVTLHVDQAIADDIQHRVMLAEHFCGMAIKVHENAASVFSAIASCRGDLAVMRTAAPWAEHFSDSSRSGVRLIGALPVIGGHSMPELLVFGHAEPQPSGNDDTVVISRGNPSSEARWRIQAGPWTITCLSGFLSDHEANPASQNGESVLVAGRYPRSIEVTA